MRPGILWAVLGVALAGCSQGGGTAREGSPLPSSGVAHVSAGVKVLAADTVAEQDFRKIISQAKTKVFPAVVFIRCVQQDFERGERATNQVAGSGVIISDTGEVLTNWHVVDKAVELRCLLYDGRAYEATVVGSDKDVDLALLKLGKPLEEGAKTDKVPFPFAAIGDSNKMQEGDFVMAMGAPWGLSRSVSLGIVACTKRYLPSASEYSAWLQTDASISPGNSGGPLVNTDGEVIGINTRGVGEGGGDIGFAVPSATIVPMIAQLRQGGKVNWSWSGLQLQPLKDFGRNIYFSGTEGVIVSETDPESPARRAGLQSRDRIMKVNGVPLAAMTDEDLPEVRRIFGLLSRTTPATLDILRGTTPMTVTLTPREEGKVEGEVVALERWDCSVSSINQFENPDLYFQKKEGVFVYGVKYPGNAQTGGLQRQDILLKVNDTTVNTLAEVRAANAETLKVFADKPRVILTVLRNGLMRQVVLDISRDYHKE